MRKTFSAIRYVSAQVKEAFSRAWAVELLVAVRAVPLQALSLLVLPLPWTLPRLLDLQVAPVVAAVEGRGGRGAIERAAELSGGGEEKPAADEEQPTTSANKKRSKSGSREFSLPSLPFLLGLSPRRAALAWPFLFLLVAPRVLAAAKEASLAALTPRMAAALPEVPLLLAALGGIGGVVMARMSDVLPFVAWRWFVREEAKAQEKEE